MVWRAVDLLDPDGIHTGRRGDVLPARRIRRWLTPSEVALYVRCPELHRRAQGTVRDERAVRRGNAVHRAWNSRVRRRFWIRRGIWSAVACGTAVLAWRGI